MMVWYFLITVGLIWEFYLLRPNWRRIDWHPFKSDELELPERRKPKLYAEQHGQWEEDFNRILGIKPASELSNSERMLEMYDRTLLTVRKQQDNTRAIVEQIHRLSNKVDKIEMPDECDGGEDCENRVHVGAFCDSTPKYLCGGHYRVEPIPVKRFCKTNEEIEVCTNWRDFYQCGGHELGDRHATDL